MQQMIFIADLIARSTCFGHNYVHHQELESIIQVVAAKAPNITGSTGTTKYALVQKTRGNPFVADATDQNCNTR
jgi:hypothetical protein